MFSSLSRPRQRSRSSLCRRPLRPRLQLESLEDRLVLDAMPIGPEFQVNTNLIPASGSSFSSPPPVAVASDADGDFVVAWAATSGFGGTTVFGRLYTRDAVPRGDVFQVNPSPLTSSFVSVSAAMDADGDFVIVYDTFTGMGNDIFAHLYTADGGDRGLVQVDPNTAAFDFAGTAAVAMNDAGNFVVAFEVFDLSTFDENVFVRRFDAAGNALADAVQVNTASSRWLNGMAIASDAAGNFVVSWLGGDFDNPQVLARRFAANGSALDAQPFSVNTSDAFLGSAPSVGVADDGNSFVIAWNNRDAGKDPLLLARRFAGDGTPQGAEFQVNDGDGGQNPPSVGVDQDGDFVIAWATFEPSFSEGFYSEGGPSNTVYFRAYSAAGVPLGPQQQVNTQSPSDLGPTAIAVDRAGDFVIAWSGPDADPNANRILARVYQVPVPVPVPDPPVEVPPRPVPPKPVVVPPIVVVGFDSATALALSRTLTTRPAPLDLILFFDSEAAILLNRPTTFRTSIVLSPLASTFRTSGTSKLGQISGRVFEDLDGDGRQGPNEAGLANQRVFLDLNDNGIPDDFEPQTVTDEKGNFMFTGLSLSRFKVRQDLRQPGLLQTLPLSNEGYEVRLSADQNLSVERNFGTRETPAANTTPSTPPAGNGVATPQAPPQGPASGEKTPESEEEE